VKSNKRKSTKTAITAFAASLLVGALSSAAMAQNNPVANFDQGYLDEHPQVAQQLSANPNLVDDPQYMEHHPGLQRYLANHPEVRADIKQHPDAFMNREDQFNGAHPGAAGNGYGYGNQGAAGRFDRGFLDEHPEVAQQLAANPSLADNPQYLANHPGLQQYLTNHPQVRQDLANHPDRFIEHADQSNGWHGQPYPNGSRPLGTTDNFLSSHPEMAQQLNQDPKLIDNPQYLAQHPELQQYLQNHPNAEQKWQSHPDRYMRREKIYSWTH